MKLPFKSTVCKIDETREKDMTTLKVANMNCGGCVRRITEALEKAKVTFKVSLENKTVAVDGDEAQVSTAIKAMSDLGFKVEK